MYFPPPLGTITASITVSDLCTANPQCLKALPLYTHNQSFLWGEERGGGSKVIATQPPQEDGLMAEKA